MWSYFSFSSSIRVAYMRTEDKINLNDSANALSDRGEGGGWHQGDGGHRGGKGGGREVGGGGGGCTWERERGWVVKSAESLWVDQKAGDKWKHCCSS